MSQKVRTHWKCDWCGFEAATEYIFGALVQAPNSIGSVQTATKQDIPAQWRRIDGSEVCRPCGDAFVEMRNTRTKAREAVVQS